VAELDPRTKAALLQAVLASPSDDAPRLVLADALTERGDPRGELIVTQCLLAERGLARDERALLTRRSQTLIDAHAAWTAAVRDLPRWVLRRGFVDEVESDAASLGAVASGLFASEPVTRLCITGVTPASITTLADDGAFARALKITLRGQLGADGTIALAAALARRTIPLVALNVGSTGIPGAAMKTLVAALAGCRSLVLTGNEIGDAGLDAVAKATALSTLEVLYVGATGITDKGLAALAASPHLAGLARLGVARNEEVTTAGLRKIAKSRKLRKLTWVEWTDEDEMQQRTATRKRR
jgi:uncharacterized protein (TIGR02996 family)